MDFEQILIRLGVDSRAVTSGLQRVTSFFKGWAAGLVHDLQHDVLGRFAGLYVFEKGIEMFDKFIEKSMFLRRLSKETGVGTNFLQGVANELRAEGEDFEKIEKPLGKLNVLFGQAKLGIAEARAKLVDWGIASKQEGFNQLTMEKGLIRLKEQFDKLSSHEEKAALLQAVFGKGYQALFPLFELSISRFKQLNDANPFTKLTEHAVETFAQLHRTSKFAGQAALATVGNLADLSLTPIINGFSGIIRGIDFVRNNLGLRPGGTAPGGGIVDIKAMEHGHDLAHATTEEYIEQLKIQEQLNTAHHLQNQLLDRSKLTVGQLADRARDILGDKRPRGLKGLHHLTPAMLSALRIQSLEDQAEVAQASGNAGAADMFQSKADELRRTNMALRSTERDPTELMRQKLEILTKTLEKFGAEGFPVREANNH